MLGEWQWMGGGEDGSGGRSLYIEQAHLGRPREDVVNIRRSSHVVHQLRSTLGQRTAVEVSLLLTQGSRVPVHPQLRRTIQCVLCSSH